jgi:hypothetical protein
MQYSLIFLPVAFVLTSGQSFATTLLGTTISEGYYVPDSSTLYANATYNPQTFVVGPLQESTIDLEGVTTFNVDFGDTSLNLPFDTSLSNPTFSNTTFNGLIFTGFGFSQIAGFTINPSTNLAGFDASRVSLTNNSLGLNFAGLSYNTDTVVSLNFTPVASAAVPEAATWAMMLAGFGVTGFMMRRRHKASQRVSYAI